MILVRDAGGLNSASDRVAEEEQSIALGDLLGMREEDV